jgi:hypothetical protein
MPWYDYERTNNVNSDAFKSTEHASCDAAWWQEAFSNDYVLTRDAFKQLLTDVQTRIETPLILQKGSTEASYDLSGRPWRNGQRGIMIRNGKKFVTR